MKCLRNFILVLIAIVAVGMFCLPLMTSAETPEGIQVKPLRRYLALDPGSTEKGTLSLKNTTGKSQVIKMSTELFSVKGVEYDYVFRGSDEVSWVVFSESSFTLRPNQTKLIRYSLAVPADASPGGHYFSLLTTIDPPKNEDGVKEIRRVASLLYLEVSGEIIRQSEFTDFNVPWLTISRTVPVDVYLSNGGNSHTRARVLLTGNSWVESLLRQSKHELAVIEGTLLPATLRKLPSEITLPNRPGFYKVTAQYSPAEGGVYSKQKTVVFIPIWFIPVLIFFIGGVVFMTGRYVISKKHNLKQHSRKMPDA